MYIKHVRHRAIAIPLLKISDKIYRVTIKEVVSNPSITAVAWLIGEEGDVPRSINMNTPGDTGLFILDGVVMRAVPLEQTWKYGTKRLREFKTTSTAMDRWLIPIEFIPAIDDPIKFLDPYF